MDQNDRRDLTAEVNILIGSLDALDDSSYESVMKMCCDMNRSIELSTVSQRRDMVLGRNPDRPPSIDRNGSQSQESYEPGSPVGAKEEEIVAVMNGLNDDDYLDVFIESSRSRSDELFKRIKEYWMCELGLAANDNHEKLKECTSERSRSESPGAVEVIDLGSPTNSTSTESTAPGLETARSRSRTRSRSPRCSRDSLKTRRRSSLNTRDYTPPPRNRRRSSSPRLRKTRSTSRPPSTPSSQDLTESQMKKVKNELFLEKLALTAEGIWTSDMEIRWKVVEIEEEKLLKEFEELEDELVIIPEKHPKYNEEWSKFWKSKVEGIRKAGEDVTKYNFVPEWKEFWIKHRMGELLELEFETKLEDIRKKHGMDLDTLIRIRTNKGEVSYGGIGQTMLRNPMASGSSNGDRFIPGHDQFLCQGELGERSSPNLKLDGFYLIQLLRRMTLLDGQLSFLAPKIYGYFEMVKEMENSRKGSAKKLFSDKDFLELLEKCRFRFEALIQTNVLPLDLTEALQKSIQNMDPVLESSQCQNVLNNEGQARRSRRSSSVHLHSLSPNVGTGAVSPGSLSQQNGHSDAYAESDNRNGNESPSSTILRRVEHLSRDQKRRLADLMTNILVGDGRGEINDNDLLEFTMKSVDPLVQLVQVAPAPVPPVSPPATPEIDLSAEVSSAAAINLSQMMWRRHELPATVSPEPPLNPLGEELESQQESEPPPAGLPWAGDYDKGLRRSIGTALPIMTPVVARAVTPPPSVMGQSLIHYQNVNPSVLGQEGALNLGEGLLGHGPNSEWIPIAGQKPGSILTFTRKPPVQNQVDEAGRNLNANAFARY